MSTAEDREWDDHQDRIAEDQARRDDVELDELDELELSDNTARLLDVTTDLDRVFAAKVYDAAVEHVEAEAAAGTGPVPPYVLLRFEDLDEVRRLQAMKAILGTIPDLIDLGTSRFTEAGRSKLGDAGGAIQLLLLRAGIDGRPLRVSYIPAPGIAAEHGTVILCTPRGARVRFDGDTVSKLTPYDRLLVL